MFTPGTSVQKWQREAPDYIALISHGHIEHSCRYGMNRMPAPASRSLLSLPEEFVLLSYLGSGKVHDSYQTAFGCAAAELGELALRRKLLVRPREFKKFGFVVNRIWLLDTGRTGLVWADELLAELEHRSVSEPKPIAAGQWLQQRRRTALRLHRDALTERGLLCHKPGRLLSRERHYPDPVVRNALIDQVRAAYHQQARLDEHMLFLGALVKGAELMKDFGLTLSWRQWRDLCRGVALSFPEDLRRTSTVLGGSVPGRGD